MEPGRDRAGRDAAQHVGGGGPDEVGPGQDALGHRGVVPAGLGRIDPLLQLDRGLPLVVDPRRARRPPRRPRRTAGRRWRSGPRRRRARRPPPRLGVPSPHRQRTVHIGPQVRRRHPPRLPDRRRPAGQRHRRQVAGPAEPGQVGHQHLAAPERPVRAVAGAVAGPARSPGRPRRCPRGRRRCARGGAARRPPRPRPAPARTSWTGSPGAGRARPAPARRRTAAGSARSPRRTSGSVSEFSRSPMCWERTACRSRSRQNVLFSSAPQPSTGRRAGHGSESGSGAYPRDRRIGVAPPAGDPDDGVVDPGVDRPVVPEDRVGDRRPAGAASSSAYAIGSSDTLPLVSTNGRPSAAASRWCSGVYGSIRPTSRLPGATEGASGASGRRGSSTIGRRRPVSSSTATGSISTSGRRSRGRRPSRRTAAPPGACAPAAPRRPTRPRRRPRGGSRRAP